MKLYCHNFGCKLNLAETQQIATQAQTIGYRLVFKWKNADIVFINGCHVTQKAHQKLLNFINRIDQQKRIIVTGCLPKDFQDKDHLQNITIFSSQEKDKIVPYLAELVADPKESSQSATSLRTRFFIKIQSGCNTGCSYCIIPHYRGRSASLSPADIIERINQLPTDTKEIVLTGTNLGQYQWQNWRLADLLKEIIRSTDIPRIRVSSIDVTDINNEIIDVFTNSRLCPHLHLALQSGSDKILHLMKRPYHRDLYLAKVRQVLKIPLLAITTDVIVGFPKETEADFMSTVDMLQQVSFLKVHAFSYSEHPHTYSAQIQPKVSANTVKDRYHRLTDIARSIRKKVMASYKNKTLPVLLEQSKHGFLTGYTPNYIPVKVATTSNNINQIVPVKIIETGAGCVIGKVSKIVNIA